MNEQENQDTTGLPRDPDGAEPARHAPRLPYGNGDHAGHSPAANPNSKPILNLWVVLDLLLQRWDWLAVGALLGAAAFYLLGWYFVKPKFTASAQLLRFETPGKSEQFKTAPISAETFAGLIRSPEILRKVGSQLEPPVPPSTLNKWIKIDPEPDSDLVKIMAAARTPEYAVNLVNLYASNAVEFIREQDAAQAEILAHDYLKKQLDGLEKDIKEVEEEFRNTPIADLTNQLAALGGKVGEISTNVAAQKPSLFGFRQQAQRLETAMQELNELLIKYTPAHPAVQAKESLIAELKKELTSASTNQSGSELSLGSLSTGPNGANRELDIVTIRLRSLSDARAELRKREQEAELYAQNKPASARVFAPADVKTVKTNMRRVKITIASVVGLFAGVGASLMLVLLVEFIDGRLKTADDVARVTKLPVLTTLGNLHDMLPEDRAQWAFRTWTLLQGRLTRTANHGFICGITSADPGEGRSTWISLLAEAASLTGYRVLTIATRPSPTHIDSDDPFPADISEYEPNQPNGHKETHPASNNALTTNVLVSPARITEELTRPNSRPVVHIPLPGWVWNLERRKQWREALVQWNRTENLVILVELPPASVPEAVLLGSNLPNMIWLTRSGTAEAGETRAHLETLRNARCNLVGAVLNRAPAPSLKDRFPRWLSLALALGLLGLSNARAQDNENPPPPLTNAPPAEISDPAGQGGSATNRTFSIVHPSQRAAWQQHLTLGPGDVLTLNLYGQPELTRTEVAIGPDGRISYLEAQDVQAAGLTIDELRGKLDEALGKYRRAPRSIITPLSFKSKKYYMLGKVATKGVYVLDQPLTLLEAIARAHGFESVLVDRNVYDLVDLQRSFISRSGQRLPVNFERLFQQGDLSQNVAIEPGDYIYFAAGDVQEVYVVGEVRLPGAVTYYPNLTIVGAITARGGFSDRAFRARVIVMRGPLSNPEKFVINTHAITDGKETDFKLKPRDIIFVNSRPFIKVEEAADLAATAFIQSIVASWVGVDVVKPVP